ncbi:MAG: Ku protein [Candidatus Aquirickettsiella gammari]|jgi:DNA end-binding protein Ku|uniref:Non-homologous end joining protein Ku n=1 Tax=Candidatus Aquirickettsiella gammari TaxID=2016198 RepID=A0A370CGU7_9COXI|nr:MAG: Ku protein [Candidatus Aquirickettsiella gammari]
MARPIWKGYITFGLINIPVILYPAEKKFDIQFKLIDSRDKARVRYVRINEHTGEEVAWSDVAKAYEYDDDNYLLLKQSDVEAISGIHSKTIDIASFVDRNSIDNMVFEKPYYLVPDKKEAKAYVLLREILKKTNKVGIAKIIIHTREYLAALTPHKNALILNLLRYHQELRASSEFKLPTSNLKSYKISSKELDIAKQLVDGMTGKWNPKDYHDVFRETLAKWAAKQIQPKKVFNKKINAITKRVNIIDFVDLLKKSIKKNKQKLSKKHIK